MSELWGGRRAPVTLLGGYLGSGKTALLNELLASASHTGRRYAVLVNDLGSVNIDAALIAKQDGDTLELSDGCVCCSLSDGFALAFERLRERALPPDQVLVELSGVADPIRVIPYTGTAGFRLDGVIVLFDLDQGLERERDRWSGDTVQRQIAGADLLVLTKRDLVDAAAEGAARSRLAELAPGAPVVLAEHGKLPPAWLAPPTRALLRDPSVSPGAPEGAHRVVSFEVSEGVGRDALERWLADLPDQVVRVKGVVPGKPGEPGDSGPLLVEGVGRRRRVRDAPREADLSEVIGTLIVITTAALDPAELPPPPSS